MVVEMQIGVVGLGRMGANIVRRLASAGHECVVFDINPAVGKSLQAVGARPVDKLEHMPSQMAESPKVVWLMLPAGRITEDAITALSHLLSKGDIIIDGGNSFYKDGIRRAAELAKLGIDFVDCGTSGGVWGLERGYCMMIGGTKRAVDHLDPIFAALAPGEGSIEKTPNRAKGDAHAEQGYLHVGPSGAGHFVKMVHNGIEYGVMQAYAEGFDILKNKSSDVLPKDERFALNVDDIAEVWRRGSVISSWLLDLTADALAKDVALEEFTGTVPDSGEGRWTVEAAIEEAVPADVLTTALFARFRSRRGHTFAEKVLSAMRAGFGGHAESSQPNVNQATDVGGEKSKP